MRAWNPEDVLSHSELLYACQLTLEIPQYIVATRFPHLTMFHTTAKKMALNDAERIQSGLFPERLTIGVPAALRALRDQGWELMNASHWLGFGGANDYQGLVLVNHQKKIVLLAHRGMQFTKENLSQALQISLQQVPPIVSDGLRMCDTALQAVSNLPSYRLVHTGFSMGGFLAQITAAYASHTNLPQYRNCVCFDPPGAADAIRLLGYRNNRHHTLVYVTSPNLVTTGTPHYGYVRQIQEYSQINPYLGRLNSLCVKAPLVIDLRKIISFDDEDAKTFRARKQLVDTTFKFHDQVELRRILGQRDNFNYVNVQSWPLATNSFDYNNTRALRSQIGSPLFDFGIDVANIVIGATAQNVLLQHNMLHNTVSHQIVNPNVTHSVYPVLTEPTIQLSQEAYLLTGITLLVMACILNQRQNGQANQQGYRSSAPQQPFNHLGDRQQPVAPGRQIDLPHNVTQGDGREVKII